MQLNEVIRKKRKELKLSQKELSMRSGVGLRFLRELEQGKKTLKMDKVNQVLKYLGYELSAIEISHQTEKNETAFEDISSL